MSTALHSRGARRRAPLVASLSSLLLVAACSVDGPLGPGRASTVPPAHDPILFVHGFNANASTWNTMVARFKADGWTSTELATWSYNYTLSNATTAAIIRTKVDSILLAT